MKNIYNYRLLKFAHHLRKLGYIVPDIEEGTVGYREGTDNPYYAVSYNIRYFHQLAAVFPDDWFSNGHFSEMFGPVLKGYDLEVFSILDAVTIYFGLNNDELAHLFDLEGGMQECDKYAGKELHFDATPQDIAVQIYQFIVKRLSEPRD